MKTAYPHIMNSIAGLGLMLWLAGGVPAQSGGKANATGDLDDFMAKVLQKRDIDWESLHGYVFNEKEVLEIKGMKIPALESFRREYVWFVRDGYLVRSPVRLNGVKVSPEEQAAAEEEWIREQKRKKRKNSLNREAFFGFKFEPGRYLYAGEREFEGRKVVAVEYYPEIDDHQKGGEEDEYERMFEKSFLATMLILPEEHQIVRITFDNVGFEFLPYRWLVRLDDIKASMVMDKPLGDVWLPREISAFGSLSTANMSLSIRYSREFYSYSKTDVRVKFWFETDKPQSKP